MEIQEYIDKYNSYYWQEERHGYLASLPKNIAKELLESLEEDEIDASVNWRTYQQDYISEFLNDIWSISEKAFWEHIRILFKSEEGLVVGETEAYIEKLCSQTMPVEVWRGFLWLILQWDRTLETKELGKYCLEVYGRIVRFQIKHAEDKNAKSKEFTEWFNSLDAEEMQRVRRTLRKAFKGRSAQWLRM